MHRVFGYKFYIPYLELLNCLFDLFNLNLAETFDLEESLASCGVNRLLPNVYQVGARVRTSLRDSRKGVLTATV